MPRRNDSLPAPVDPVGMRVDVSRKTRDKFRKIASGHGYTMAALVRLIVEEVSKNPKEMLKNIPKNPE